MLHICLLVDASLVCKVLDPHNIHVYMFFIYLLIFSMTLLMTIDPAYMAEENQEFHDGELKLTFCKTG